MLTGKITEGLNLIIT